MYRILRFSVSLALGAVVAIVIFSEAIRLLSHRSPDAVEKETIWSSVRLLTPAERLALSPLIDRDVDTDRTPKPPPAPPPFDLPRRQIRGFVQLEVEIGADGSVEEIEVLGSTPAGIYENQARDIVAARRYEPDIVNGRAVRATRVEIVEFSVEASKPK